MNQILIDEAVNGYMLIIIWDNDPIQKEVFERKLDLYEAIDKWIQQKQKEHIRSLEVIA